MTDLNDSSGGPREGWRDTHNGLLWWYEDERFTQPQVWPYQVPEHDVNTAEELTGAADPSTTNGDDHE
jgi:hypothetical protein